MQDEEKKEALRSTLPPTSIEKGTLDSTPPPSTSEKGNRLEKIEQRIAQLEAQKKAILAREKEKARKERTRRLIQIGAISLNYLNLPDTIEPAEFEQVMQRVVVIVKSRQQQTESSSSPPPTE